jgi:hypothetical protein
MEHRFLVEISSYEVRDWYDANSFASDGSSLQAVARKTSLGRELLIGRRIGP